MKFVGVKPSGRRKEKREGINVPAEPPLRRRHQPEGKCLVFVEGNRPPEKKKSSKMEGEDKVQQVINETNLCQRGSDAGARPSWNKPRTLAGNGNCWITPGGEGLAGGGTGGGNGRGGRGGKELGVSKKQSHGIPRGQMSRLLHWKKIIHPTPNPKNLPLGGGKKAA